MDKNRFHFYGVPRAIPVLISVLLQWIPPLPSCSFGSRLRLYHLRFISLSKHSSFVSRQDCSVLLWLNILRWKEASYDASFRIDVHSWFLEIHKYDKSIRFLTYSILIAKKIFLYVGVEKKLVTKRRRKDALSVKLCIFGFLYFSKWKWEIYTHYLFLKVDELSWLILCLIWRPVKCNDVD